MGKMVRKLIKMSGHQTGSAIIQGRTTYRESYYWNYYPDEIIVELKKKLFKDRKMPVEINVTIEWRDPEVQAVTNNTKPDSS